MQQNLTEKIYKGLKESRDPSKNILEKVVKTSCMQRLVLEAIEEPHNVGMEPRGELFLERYDEGLRKLVSKWAQQCVSFKGRLSRTSAAPEPEASVETLYGMQDYEEPRLALDGALLRTFPVSSQQFESATRRDTLPMWAKISACVEAHQTGLSSAYALLLDRNSLAWAAWKITGDFEELSLEVLKDVGYLHGLLTEGGEPDGVASSCLSCPFTSACEVPPERKLKALPFPRKGIRAVREEFLTRELDAHLRDFKEPNTRRDGVIHPSEFAAFRCDRRQAYSLQETPRVEHIRPQLRRIFAVGHLCHDIVQGVLGKGIEKFAAEVEVEDPKLKIYGHCDGAWDDEGIEIKSISYKGFEKLGSSPKKEHAIQGTTYGSILGLKHMTYIYINKNTGDINSIRTPLSKSAWNTLAARATRIVLAVERGELPPRIEKTYHCRGCPFQHVCRPELKEKGYA